MIKLITGTKGTGKTKTMIEMINKSAETTPGNVVCIEKSMKLTYDVSHKVRLIDVDEYAIDGYETLYGFIAGVLAGNYDIVEVYIDGVLKIGGGDLVGLECLLKKLESLSKGSVSFVITVSADVETLTPGIKAYL
ncbi:MAG: hypothetical protein IJ412_08635 [Oscillospiraceae bacterium]|nr:hypothetical protein [Oscillospiraceae bacterium]